MWIGPEDTPTRKARKVASTSRKNVKAAKAAIRKVASTRVDDLADEVDPANPWQGPARTHPPVSMPQRLTAESLMMPHELLTPADCVVALIDHRPQMLFGVTNFDRQGVINNTLGLARAAKLFDVLDIRRWTLATQLQLRRPAP